MAIAKTQLFLRSLLLARSRRLNLLSISLFHFHQNLSTLSHADNTQSANAHSHHPNTFAHFATTKFHLSYADISRMFKIKPALERLKTLEKVEQFVDLLKRYGFTQHQVAFTMKRQPTCLSVWPEKVIEPTLLLLQDLGIHGEDLAKAVTRSPNILSSSLQGTLIPNAAFLQDIFKTQDLFMKAILRLPSILGYDLEKYLKPSVALFEECGLVGEELSKFISTRPRLLLCASLTPAKADFLQKIGVHKGSKMYKHVLAMVVPSRQETLNAKIVNFQQCGLTVEETMELFRVSPYSFNFSNERVRQHMNFIVNDMELPANLVLKLGCLLTQNLRVVKPKVLVLKRIHTLNNLGHLDIRGLRSILTMSEDKIVKMIKGHPESRLLNEIYQKALTDTSAMTKAGTKNSKRTWCF